MSQEDVARVRPVPFTNLKILVVEDVIELRQTITSILTRRGARVVEAQEGVEALEILNNQSVDLIISDINMHGLNGIDFFKRIQNKRIPFIFMTGLSDILQLQEAYKLGANDFLSKPFGLAELVESVNLALQVTVDQNLSNENLDSKFHPIPLDEIGLATHLGVDRFVRLSPEKYLRVARAGEAIANERLSLYKGQGLQQLFVKRPSDQK